MAKPQKGVSEMKPRKLTLISLTLLALLVFGTVVLIISTGQEPLECDQVKLTPKTIDMTNTPSLEVELKLTIGEEPDVVTIVDEINASTVQLEGMAAPTDTWVTLDKKGDPDTFVAEFAGSAVKGVIWHLIGHMGLSKPNPDSPLTIRLHIAGELNDGTPWTGSALAVVWNWFTTDPPPPPPP